MPNVFVNGIYIYYEIHGTGVPLIIIGGLASDVTYYEGIIRQLSYKYQVIAFDNRGAGRTDKPDVPYSIEMMADDTAGLLEALGITHAHVLGISMGGRIAVELTLQHPEQVKSLILASTAVKPLPTTWPHRMLDVFLKLPILRTVGRRYPQPVYAALRQREATYNYDATGRLREIRVPTLILHGTSDKLAPCALAAEMHARIQGSKMLVFSGGHHFLFVRQTQFIAAVEDFLTTQTTGCSIPLTMQLSVIPFSLQTKRSEPATERYECSVLRCLRLLILPSCSASSMRASTRLMSL